MTFPKLSATCLASALALCAGTAQADTTLRMSNWAPANSTLTLQVLQPWADAVHEATEGRVTIQLLPTPLGSPQQHYELARQGIADISWGNLTYEPERFKNIWFAELPLSGDGGVAASTALWDTFSTYLADLPAYEGTHMLATGLMGGGSIHHSEKALTEPEDFEGQKIRMGGPIQQRLLEEMGAIPVAGAATQAYELVDSGVIDGSLHALQSIAEFSLEEALPYHTLVDGGFYDGVFFVAMNQRAWDRLEPADQEAVMSVSGLAFSQAWGRFFDEDNARVEADLIEAGYTIAAPGQAMADKIAEVRATMEGEWTADGDSFGLPNAAEVVDHYRAAYDAALATQVGE